jgi:hypothetical protein
VIGIRRRTWPLTLFHMDGKIRFETKEESNARREAAFLALPPAERLLWFLRSFNGRQVGPTDQAKDRSGHFIIQKRIDAV